MTYILADVELNTLGALTGKPQLLEEIVETYKGYNRVPAYDDSYIYGVIEIALDNLERRSLVLSQKTIITSPPHDVITETVYQCTSNGTGEYIRRTGV